MAHNYNKIVKRGYRIHKSIDKFIVSNYYTFKKYIRRTQWDLFV